MWRKIVVAVVVGIVLLAAAGAGAAWLYVGYRERQTQQWLELANQSYAEGDWAMARNRFFSYLPRRPNDTEALWKFADCNLKLTANRQDSLAKAITAYNQLLRFEPDNLAAQRNLIDCLYKLGSWATLEFYAKDYLENNPDDAEVRFLLAMAQTYTGQSVEAIKLLTDLAINEEPDGEVYAFLLELHDNRAELRAAEGIIAQAEKAHPEHPVVQAAKGHLYLLEDDVAAAGQALARAEELAPDEPYVLRLQAEHAIRVRRWLEARAYAERLVAVKSDDGRSYVLLAQIVARLGDSDEAIRILQDVDPVVRADQPELYLTLAEVQMSARQFDEARKTCQEYVEVRPNQEYLLEYLEARELIATGKPDEAVNVLNTLVTYQPQFSPGRYYLALAYLAAGRTELGRATLESYLTQYPDDSRAHALLAQETGGVQSLPLLRESANEALEDPTATPDRLTALASAIFSIAGSTGQLEQHRGIVQQLFSELVTRDPQSPAGYQGLAELAATDGDIQAARRYIEQAREAGVSEDDLRPAVASLALRQGDLATADAQFEQALASQELREGDVLAWANLYRERGFPAKSGWVLAQALERRPDLERSTLEIEGMRAAALAGQVAEAKRMDQALRNRIAPDAREAGRLLDAQVALVRACLAEGGDENVEYARDLVRLIREAAPDRNSLVPLEAFVLVREQSPDLVHARELLNQALQTNPGSLDALAGLAHVAAVEGDFAEAAVHLERAVTQAPEAPGYRLQLAEMYQRQRRFEEAKEHLRLLIKARPDLDEASELLVWSLIASGEYAEAAEILSSLETSSQDDPERMERLRAMRGELLLASGRTDEAVALLRAQHEADPEHFATVRGLASALGQQGNDEEAATMLKEYAQEHSEDVDAWLTYARFQLQRQGETGMEEASRALNQALVVNPNYLPTLRELIDLQIRRKNASQALNLIEHYLRVNQDDPDVLFAKARLLAEVEQDSVGALEAVNQAIALRNDQPQYFYARAVLLMAQERFAEALDDLRHLEEAISPTPASVDLMLAQAYARTGRQDLADRHARLAREKQDAGDVVDPRFQRLLEQGLSTASAPPVG